MFIDWGYVAGFFDGEGCVYHGAGHGIHSFRLEFAQKDRKPLDAIKEFLATHGVHGVIGGNTVIYKGGPRKVWLLKVSGRDSLLSLLPRLIERVSVKRTALQDMHRFLRMYPKLSSFVTAERNRARRKSY